MGLAALLAAASLATTPAAFVASHQQADGGFAEAGSQSTPGLTAWASFGLRAAGRSPSRAAEYLVAHERELQTATDIELALIAEAALGRVSEPLYARLAALRRPDGRIGPAINSTAWGILAYAQVGRPVKPGVTYLLRQQRRSGGWSWIAGGAPDSNDTAAVIQALRARGVRGRPITRGIAYLRRLQNADGGFELTAGRGSDAQSTAWAIQAFVAARLKPPAKAFRYLAALRRPDGSYRYSKRYGATPVWVTSQVLVALSHKAFPLR
ncbi:MAG: energy-coupling factor transport system substrate-specific component [Gaiellaceae bacterium]|nr:energy-coupling factor transport system substrate-specific component [Gaiellaceae bacterium]